MLVLTAQVRMRIRWQCASYAIIVPVLPRNNQGVVVSTCWFIHGCFINTLTSYFVVMLGNTEVTQMELSFHGDHSCHYQVWSISSESPLTVWEQDIRPISRNAYGLLSQASSYLSVPPRCHNCLPFSLNAICPFILRKSFISSFNVLWQLWQVTLRIVLSGRGQMKGPSHHKRKG
jgi:hypothetical protein